MNLLLTNDDGYASEGIQLLKEKLLKKHTVYLCAPIKQMSATSHAITLFKPMEIKELNKKEFALDGTPADCIKIALFHLFKDIKFDIVISGVNNGPNMGEDIYYSGTVAGAREGAMNKIFSVAASLDGWDGEKNFQFSTDFIAELVNNMKAKILQENIVLNINFPNIKKPKGVKITHLGERIYQDFVSIERMNDKVFVTIKGDDPSFNDLIGSDLNSVSEGYISITPIANEVNDPEMIERLKFLEKINWEYQTEKIS